MARTLVIYSTTDGHTLKISQTLVDHLTQSLQDVILMPVEEVNSATLQEFDCIVIGASIRYGKHQAVVADLIKTNKTLLESKKTAFYTVNLVARKSEKNQPDTNPYIIKFLQELAWQPSLQGVFAGRLNYPKYGLIDRHMIRFIMWMTKGPTDLKSDTEFTDWQSVKNFANAIRKLV